MATEVFRDARALGLYSPIKNEVLTEEILCVALKTHKRVAFPQVHERFLKFFEVQSTEDLQQGRFGIAEPVTETACPLTELDLLIVPGVAFDVQGGRLGYGKGFFDRTLQRSKKTPILVGLCYEIQLVTFLPKEYHDVRMDAVATERRLIWREESQPLRRSEL